MTPAEVATMLEPVTARADEFSSAIGPVSGESWYRTLDRFEDASIFQTPAFCRATTPRAGLEQLVVWRGTEAAAAALVRVVGIPLLGAIAYVLWGPMCHRRGGTRDPDALAQALVALRAEYVVNRRVGLRVSPFLIREDGVEWSARFIAHGYRQTITRVPKRTILIPLDRPLDQLRKGLDQKWRNCLNAAERNNLTVHQGDDDSLFELFGELHRDMLARKRLGEAGDLRGFRAAQAALPDRCKLRVFVALEDGRPSAGVVCSAVGQRGVYVLGATGSDGMRNRASYLLHWRAIEWLRERNCRVYDLHGINAEANPGVYAFKKGLSGKNGSEAELMGPFDACEGIRARLLMATAGRANESYKRLKTVYRRYRGIEGRGGRPQ
jgi:lipid II:glycine glycyltransferase (peptidoglycan interpeptide bridge formation enzyme)